MPSCAAKERKGKKEEGGCDEGRRKQMDVGDGQEQHNECGTCGGENESFKSVWLAKVIRAYLSPPSTSLRYAQGKRDMTQLNDEPV